MKLTPYFVLIFGVMVVGGCATNTSATKTSLEIQAIQAKTFEANKKTAFNSVMSVFQDFGYIIGSASLDTGFITAESPNQQDNSGGAVFATIFAGVRTEVKTAVTASIEELAPNAIRVRLNFVTRQRRSGAYGQNASDDSPVEDPTVYQNAFDKIGEAIFVRSSQK